MESKYSMKLRSGLFRSFFFVGSDFSFLLFRSSEGVQYGCGQQLEHTQASPPGRISHSQVGVEEAEGGVVWHLVGLLGPEQDEVDEESMEEMAESVVLEGEAGLEEVVADLEADGAGSEPDVVELEEDVVELEDDDVELVDEELENHSGDRNFCSNQDGDSRTLGVSILGPSYEYLKQLDDEARVVMEGYTLL